MRNRTGKIDFLRDKPVVVLMSVCAPLVLVNVVQLFTTFCVNEMHSRYVGQDYFTVVGYLNTVLNAYGAFLGGIASAAWIRIAKFFATGDQAMARRQTVQAICAVALVWALLTALLLLLGDAVFQLLHVPEEIFRQAKLYYTVYLTSYLPVPLAAVLLSVVTGTGSAGSILLVNLLTVVLSVVNTALLLAVFQLGMAGGALLTACNGAVQLLIAAVFLHRDGLIRIAAVRELLPDGRRILDIVGYGLLLSAQTMLCNVGYLVVTAQTNRWLSLAYISVLQVTLPLSSVMSAISQACAVFYPQNYGAGQTKRVRQFFNWSTIGCAAYGAVCFAVFGAAARWYYGQLFSDPVIVELGVEYWFWYGLGHIAIACLYTVRMFFDAVGMGKISVLAGLGELAGNLLCAFWLIPRYGNIGRSLSYPVGWAAASVILLLAYALCRRRIYRKCDAWATPGA